MNIDKISSTTFYHGTSKAFTEFDLEKFGQNEKRGDIVGKALFFAFDQDTAMKYAIQAGGNTIIPVKLSMNNPLVISKGSKVPLEYYDSIDPSLYLSEEKMSALSHCNPLVVNRYAHLFMSQEERAEYCKMKGYDGMIDHNSNQAAVLSASQVEVLPVNTSHCDSKTEFDLYAALTNIKYDLRRIKVRIDSPYSNHTHSEMDKSIQEYLSLLPQVLQSRFPAVQRAQKQIESNPYVYKSIARRKELLCTDSIQIPKITLFHGTNTVFDQFHEEALGSNTEYVGSHSAAFFTASYDLAKNYAHGAVFRHGGSPEILKFEVSLDRAFFYETSTAFYRDLDKYGMAMLSDIKASGFDGVVVRDCLEEVVVFDVLSPTRTLEAQIKQPANTNVTNAIEDEAFKITI